MIGLHGFDLINRIKILIGAPLKHVFSHSLRAFASATPNVGDYSTDPVVVDLARHSDRDLLERSLTSL